MKKLLPLYLHQSQMLLMTNQSSKSLHHGGCEWASRVLMVQCFLHPQLMEAVSLQLEEAGRMLVCEPVGGPLTEPRGEEGGQLRCPVCGRPSSRRDHLRRPMRIHTGEKPHKCPYCPFRSLLKWNVKSHMQRRHSLHWMPLAGSQ